MNVIRKVPITSGRTPKLGGSKSGVHLPPERKSQRPTLPKKSIVSRSSAITIPVVVRTEISAARISSALMISSPQRRRAAPNAGTGRAPAAVVVAEASIA